MSQRQPPTSSRSLRKRARIASVVPTGFSISVAQALPEVTRRIARALKPDKIILFGSYAYGVPSPDSDVDLLIVMKTRLSAKERYLAVSRLIDPRPFPMDILVKTPREVDRALRTGDFFMQEIVSRGRVLYG